MFWGRKNKTVIPPKRVGYEMIKANSYLTRTRGIMNCKLPCQLQLGKKEQIT